MSEPLSRNIEVKARWDDLPAAERACLALGATDAGVLVQTDMYFAVQTGRLKLREIAGQTSELIWYTRTDDARPRQSDYLVVACSDADGLKAALTRAMGARCTVSKRRRLLRFENVRIHLDEIQELGSFIEFEAVISPGQTEADGHARIAVLCRAIGITQEHFERLSYVDLMLAQKLLKYG